MAVNIDDTAITTIGVVRRTPVGAIALIVPGGIVAIDIVRLAPVGALTPAITGAVITGAVITGAVIPGAVIIGAVIPGAVIPGTIATFGPAEIIAPIAPIIRMRKGRNGSGHTGQRRNAGTNTGDERFRLKCHDTLS